MIGICRLIAFAVAYVLGIYLLATYRAPAGQVEPYKPVKIVCPVMWYDLWTGAFLDCTNHPLWAPEIGPMA